MGLVAFAGDAFLECPLTIDNTAFQQSVQALDVNSIPQGGTAIAGGDQHGADGVQGKDAAQGARAVHRRRGQRQRAGALEAAQNAAKDGLKIFTIGIGSAEGTLVTVAGADGNTDYVRDEKGQVVKSKFERGAAQPDGRRRPADFICRCAARTRWTRFTSAASRRCRNRRAAKNWCGAITSSSTGRWRRRCCCCWRKYFCRSAVFADGHQTQRQNSGNRHVASRFYFYRLPPTLRRLRRCAITIGQFHKCAG